MSRPAPRWVLWCWALCLASSPAGADTRAAAQTVVVVSDRTAAEDEALLDEVAAHVNRFRGPDRRILVRHVMQRGMTPSHVAQLRRTLATLSYAVLYARSMNLARLAHQADGRTPIVFDGQGDPVLSCLVDSDVRPGRNVTGFTSYVPYLTKMAETLLQAFPATAHVIVLDADTGAASTICSGPAPAPWPAARATPCGAPQLQSDIPSSPTTELADVHRYLNARGVRVSFLRLCEERGVQGVAAAIAPAAAAAPTAVIVPLYSLLFRQSKALIRDIDSLRVPAIYTRRKFLDDGGLLALSPTDEQPPRRRSLELLDQMLDGADPAVTPVRRPTGFTTFLNVAAARRTGLRPTVPFLRRTDEFLRR